jgi:hypothetical protein
MAIGIGIPRVELRKLQPPQTDQPKVFCCFFSEKKSFLTCQP